MEGSSIRIPQVATEYGATFGAEIQDADREWAAAREPIGSFVVYRVAKSVFKNWFRIDDPRTSKDRDPELNRKVQKRLTALKAKRELRKALEWERLYGWSLLVGRFDDAHSNEDLSAEKPKDAELVEVVAYPRTKVTSIQKDNKPTSDRFGEPEVYNITRGSGLSRMKVHHTRVIRVSTRTDEKSVIDPIYDDLSTFRNERWGLGQTLWRYGSGFPVLQIKGYTVEQLLALKESGNFKDLMSRSYALTNGDMTLTFAGAQQAALNPAPYIKPVIENISAGCGIPEPILRGAQAGALTGSELNEREYWDFIATIQSDVEPFVRELITWAKVGQEDLEALEDYDIIWLSGFEVTELDQARLDLTKEQANEVRLRYMKLNEVRKFNEIEEELPITDEQEVERMMGAKAAEPGGSQPPSQAPTGEPNTPGPRALAQEAQRTQLMVSLEGIKDRCVAGELSADQAMSEAGAVIRQFADVEKRRALDYLQKRMRKPVGSLPAETARKIDRQVDGWIADFEEILQVALQQAGT